MLSKGAVSKRLMPSISSQPQSLPPTNPPIPPATNAENVSSSIAPSTFDLKSIMLNAEAAAHPLSQSLSFDIQNLSMGKAQANYQLASLELDFDPPISALPAAKEEPQHFKPTQHALNSFLGTTEFKLDTKEDDLTPNKPVAFQTEHKINAPVLDLKSTFLQSTTSFESNFKARLEGTESEPGVFNTEKPADMQGKIGVKQKFSGQMLGLKYEADAFASQSVAAKDLELGELAPVSKGASAALGYSLGHADMQIKASTTGEKQQTQATVGYAFGKIANVQLKGTSAHDGKAEALATFNYKQGITKGSVFAGQEFDTVNTVDKMGVRLDLGGDHLQSYISGELRSSGKETLKTGLSLKFDHLKLSTEAGFTGTDQRFNQMHLRQTVGFEHKGLSLNASVDPLSFSSTPNFQLGLRFKKSF